MRTPPRMPGLLMAVAATWSLAASAPAQPPQVQGGRSGGHHLSPEEMLQRRSERLEEFLRRMDTNGNGMIDADEVTGGQKLLLERMIVPTGMELKYPLVIDQVRQSVMKSYQSLVPTGNSGPTGGVSPRGETAAKAAPWPAGSAMASPPVAVPAASSPIGSATVGPRAEPSLDAAGTTTARPSRATPASATTSPSAPLRKSGRFLRPIERLPKGLPDWFTARDADGDGQVSMAEFTTDWTPAKVAEFARYDPNGDGVIASAECLKVEKRSQRP